MIKLLFSQSKFWFILILVSLFLITGSISYLATDSRSPKIKPKKPGQKIDLTDRYSNLDESLVTNQTTENSNNSDRLISRKDLLDLIRPSQGCPRLQPTLYDLSLETYQGRFALAHNIVILSNKARVILVVGSATAALPSGYLIDTKRRFKQNILADVPVYLLCSLANENNIDQIRVPTSGELLDLSGATGTVGISDLLNQAKKGYQPNNLDFKKYGIDPQIFYDLLDKLKKSDVNVRQF